MKEWFELSDTIAESIVKIETPRGHGTGFLCAIGKNPPMIAIATAQHVVGEADKWQSPIRIHNVVKNAIVLIHEADRIVFPDVKADSASIIIFDETKAAALQLPKESIQFIPSGQHMRVGAEVAWFGYPAIASDTLCFFSGRISAWDEAKQSYFIDGVAIPGVSGGPVLCRIGDSVNVVGLITAYRRLTGEMIPGLSVAQNVTHFQHVVTTFKNRDEAAQKKKEQEALIEAGTIPSAGTAPSSTSSE